MFNYCNINYVTRHDPLAKAGLGKTRGGISIGQVKRGGDGRGKLVYEQRMWNMTYFALASLFLGGYGYIHSLGILRAISKEVVDNKGFWEVVAFTELSLCTVLICVSAIVFDSAKIQVYNNGMVNPTSLIRNLKHKRKYKVWGTFIPFESIIDIKIEGEYYLFIDIKEHPEIKGKIAGGYFWKTKQREDFLKALIRSRNSYYERKKDSNLKALRGPLKTRIISGRV